MSKAPSPLSYFHNHTNSPPVLGCNIIEATTSLSVYQRAILPHSVSTSERYYLTRCLPASDTTSLGVYQRAILPHSVSTSERYYLTQCLPASDTTSLGVYQRAILPPSVSTSERQLQEMALITGIVWFTVNNPLMFVTCVKMVTLFVTCGKRKSEKIATTYLISPVRSEPFPWPTHWILMAMDVLLITFFTW